jgi:FtsP/CotA-like multicopper oxidase with cupredoxin domain
MIIRTLRTACILGTVAVLLGPGAVAQPDESQDKRLLADPPMARPDVHNYYDIFAQTTDYHLYNPNTGKNDNVELRTYWAPGMKPGLRPVGPTIETTPGATLYLELHNRLPGPAHCDRGPNHNEPKCFDYTNFHTHGLWVTPKDPGDNVLLDVDVGETHKFAFELPAEHPAGTFWYHAHVHGSTAVQVASGMSGALIVRGNRQPTMTTNGDIDTLVGRVARKERILLFQQIAYACKDSNNTPRWDCTNKTGSIDNFNMLSAGQWLSSGRFTSINGEVLPEFPDAVAGNTERWRMIHGGISATISVFLRAAKPGAEMPPRLTPIQAGKWIVDNCTGDVAHQFSIAADGLTRSRIVDRGDKKPTTLQPGYREDVLVTFPKAGLYCVIDTATSIGASQEPENRALLGVIRVAPGRDVADQRADLETQLRGAAELAYPGNVAGKVIGDIRNGLKLSSFQPHKDLRAETKVGRQELAFVMDNPARVGTKLDGSNAIAYDGRMARTLMLDTTDEWTMASPAGNHPFHVHVNPFQIVKILDPQGRDVSESGEPNDAQYADLKGEWKDTIFIKQGYKVIMRTHYARFDGVFVLHCHILNHEDMGMMEKIQICKPGGPCESMGGGGMSH